MVQLFSPSLLRAATSVNGHADRAYPGRLAPHLQKWLANWDRQFYLYMTGQDLNAIRRCPVDAFRAVMQYADNPASLVGSIPTPDHSNEI